MPVRRLKNNIAISLAVMDRWRRKNDARNISGLENIRAVGQEIARDGFLPWELSQDRKSSLLDSYAKLRNRAGHAQVEKHTGKAFFQPELSAADLKDFPVFLETAMDTPLLKTVACAMGMVPHLEAVEILQSTPQGGELSASQLWHRDSNDKAILKLFVYLSDVSDENGPFTFVRRPVSRLVPRGLPHYIDDARLDRHVERKTWCSVLGAAGTAFLIDTRNCLHCGSRCREPRVAYIATYSSGLKFMHLAKRWESITEGFTALEPLQKRVLGLS